MKRLFISHIFPSAGFFFYTKEQQADKAQQAGDDVSTSTSQPKAAFNLSAITSSESVIKITSEHIARIPRYVFPFVISISSLSSPIPLIAM
jgi:hypothetical protein